METFLRFGLGNVVLAMSLAMLAAAAGCLLGRRPALRHALWLLVLLKLITPPLSMVPVDRLPIPRPHHERPVCRVNFDAVGRDEPVEDEPAGSAVPMGEPAVAGESVPAEAGMDLKRGLARLAVAVWLSGSLLIGGVAAVRLGRWSRVLKKLRLAPGEVQDEVADLAARMGLPAPPGVWWSPGTAAPMLWACCGRARLIVPQTLWTRLDERQRTTLLVHELAHLRRRDHWVRLVELATTAVYWWLPLVWVARRALREAEEQCCDAWVVWACPDAVRTYAETLVETVEFLAEARTALPLAASGFGHVHHLKRRIRMIMQERTPRTLSWTGTLTMLGLSAALLPVSPTWARDSDRESPAEQAPVVTPGSSRHSEPNAWQPLHFYTVGQLSDEESGKAKAAVGAQVKAKTDDDEHEAQERTDYWKSKVAGEVDRALKKEAQVLEAKLKDVLTKIEIQTGQATESKQAQAQAEQAVRRAREKLGSGAERARELARARVMVERARAELRLAESRLAKLEGIQSPFKTQGGVRYEVFTKGPLFISPKAEPAVPRDHEAQSTRPERDRRLTEIEKQLDQLLQEVKSLKGGGSDRR